MKEYDDETLHHVQQCELAIFDDFVDVCESEGLTYFALAGTVLGAVRHQGFIPWDDDIDVGLPRKDFERLVEVVQEKYPDKYVMMNAATDIRYPLPTTRMMLKGTEFCEEALADVQCFMGIFLDIYCFDNVSDDEKEYRKQARTAWFWSHVRMLIDIPKPVLPFHGAIGAIATKVCQISSWTFRTVGITPHRALERETAALKRYQDRKTERMGYLCDTSPYTNTIAWEHLSPLVEIGFEGRTINVPANYDEHLRGLYGDYMQLPPVEQRKNHYPARLNFGPY